MSSSLTSLLSPILSYLPHLPLTTTTTSQYPPLLILSLYLYLVSCFVILYVAICGGVRCLHSEGGLIGRVHRWMMGVCREKPLSSSSSSSSGKDQNPADMDNSNNNNTATPSAGISSYLCCCGPLFRKLESYLCYSKNPLMQLMYLGLLGVNASYFFTTVYFHFQDVETIGPIHYFTGPVVLLVALLSFFAASYSNPGIITKKNHRNFISLYEHNVCYPEKRVCHTCKILKPARSKHCSLTGRCISRFDHFCPWLNNAVGEWNYRWFHLFLISNCIMAFYGTYLIVMFLWGIVQRDQLLTAHYMSPSGTPIAASPAIVLQYIMTRYIWLLAQVIFGSCIGFMLFLFWGYHFVRMTLFNTTTNETFKMSEVEDWMEALQMDPQCFDDEWDELLPFQQYQVTQLKRMIERKESLKNPYYISLWENIMEVISPPSLRNYKESKFSTKED